MAEKKRGEREREKERKGTERKGDKGEIGREGKVQRMV